MTDYLDDETHDDIWPRGLAAKRAASWWDAAKSYCRSDRVRAGQIAELVGERDALQARIAAALALMDYWDAHGGSIPQGHRLRAALQGDQATEPVKRCCIGPFADGTHAPGCLDACQDCGGDEAGPHRCQCSDADPACTCTPSRCDYDGYPLDGPACLPCGQRPEGTPCLAIDEPTGEADRG